MDLFALCRGAYRWTMNVILGEACGLQMRDTGGWDIPGQLCLMATITLGEAVDVFRDCTGGHI